MNLGRSLKLAAATGAIVGLIFGVIWLFTNYAIAHEQACAEGLLFISVDAKDPMPGTPYALADVREAGVQPVTPQDDINALAVDARAIVVHVDAVEAVGPEWLQERFGEAKAIALVGDNIYTLSEILDRKDMVVGHTYRDIPPAQIPVARMFEEIRKDSRSSGAGQTEMHSPRFDSYRPFQSLVLFSARGCLDRAMDLQVLIPRELNHWFRNMPR